MKQVKEQERLGQFQDNTGFSIVEVLLALTVFAIGMLAISSLQVATITSNGKSQRTIEAANLAQQQVEALMGADYDGVADTGPTLMNDRYTVSWDVVQEVANTKDVDLTVAWNEGSQQKDITYSFVLWNSTF